MNIKLLFISNIFISLFKLAINFLLFFFAVWIKQDQKSVINEKYIWIKCEFQIMSKNCKKCISDSDFTEFCENGEYDEFNYGKNILEKSLNAIFVLIVFDCLMTLLFVNMQIIFFKIKSRKKLRVINLLKMIFTLCNLVLLIIFSTILIANADKKYLENNYQITNIATFWTIVILIVPILMFCGLVATFLLHRYYHSNDSTIICLKSSLVPENKKDVRDIKEKSEEKCTKKSKIGNLPDEEANHESQNDISIKV